MKEQNNKTTKPGNKRQEVEKKTYRKSVLVLPHKVYLTAEAFKILKKAKRRMHQSMARIACDLIVKNLKK